MTRITRATVHSIDRARERFATNEKTATKNIHLALERGKTADEFTSKERDFLINTAQGDVTALAYNNFCYLVNSEGFCVTMYPLPAWFGKKKHFDGKERIRNVKTYAKHHANNYDYYECC